MSRIKPSVAGVGMVPFAKPGKSEDYDVMARGAVRAALADAGIDYDAVQQAYAGYVYGDSTCGQRALYGVGLTGIPVFNVNNNCSTGSSALFLARQAVEPAAPPSACSRSASSRWSAARSARQWTDRPDPFARLRRGQRAACRASSDAPLAAQCFGGAGADYAEQLRHRRRRPSRRSRSRRASTRPTTRTRCSATRSPSRRSWRRRRSSAR